MLHTFQPATAAPSRRRVFQLALGASALTAWPALAQTPTPSAKPAQPQPLSLTLNAEQRASLWRALAEADQHGFEPGEFADADLGDRLGSSDKDELGKAQAELIAAVVRYARAQHGLRASRGEDWPKTWALRPAAYDAEKDLAFAASQNKVGDWLNSLPPPFARYRQLKSALAELRASSRTAAGKRKGDRPAKAAAVKPHASSSPSRAEQITALRANMERWRWMPRNISPDRIEVNTASGLLQVVQDNKPTLAMKCAAGKKGDETPILTSSIDSIVFNPAWHIPKSIAAKELYPKNRRQPGYFKREGIINSKESESGLLQKPGPKNALGQIKFDFKNAFSVYLHDTPAQSAFARAGRNVSHGCVRVEKPVDLAALLLQGTPDGNRQAIQSLIGGAAGGGEGQGAQPKPPPESGKTEPAEPPDIQTKRVDVPKPMPVFLLYWTAFPGEGGKVAYAKDVYGWDAKLLALLAAGRKPRAAEA